GGEAERLKHEGHEEHEGEAQEIETRSTRSTRRKSSLIQLLLLSPCAPCAPCFSLSVFVLPSCSSCFRLFPGPRALRSKGKAPAQVEQGFDHQHAREHDREPGEQRREVD